MAKARIAGQIFNAAKAAGKGTSKLLGLDRMSAGDKAMRFGLDGLYSVMGAAATPGDLGDKLIAGAGDFALSAGTGLVLAAPLKNRPGAANVVDNIGSVAGWQLGQPAIEGTMRLKDKAMGGEGLSAYERASLEYEQQLRAQVIAELDAAGLLNADLKQLVTNDNTGMY